MCVYYSLRNVECYISDMFFDSSASINYVALRWTICLDSFTVIHKWIFALANVLFNHSWWCRWVSVLQFGHQPPYYFVYTSSEGSVKSTYTYAQAHLSLHCSGLRQVPNQMGLFLWSVLSLLVNLFCLIWTMQIIIRLQFGINDNVHIWHAKYHLILSATQFYC